MLSVLEKLNVRSLIVIFFVLSNCTLAVFNEKYRPDFNQLSEMVIAGYFAQLKPKS